MKHKHETSTAHQEGFAIPPFFVLRQFAAWHLPHGLPPSHCPLYKLKLLNICIFFKILRAHNKTLYMNGKYIIWLDIYGYRIPIRYLYMVTELEWKNYKKIIFKKGIFCIHLFTLEIFSGHVSMVIRYIWTVGEGRRMGVWITWPRLRAVRGFLSWQVHT